MGKIVAVSVVREHSGDAGHHPEKSTYQTTLQHARQLKAQGLVEFDEEEAKDDATDQSPASTTVSGLKSEARPRNKAEPAPANKAEGNSLNKGSQK